MFIMLAGPAGVGKSTWAKNFKDEYPDETVIISSDSIRAELFGDESVQKNPEQVFSFAHQRIICALEENIPYVIFDATNIKRKNRMALMNKIKRFNCLKKCVVFAEPYNVLCLRNECRQRQVPEEAIWRMITSFETPLESEGYDVIELVNEEKISLAAYSGYMEDFDQNNSHHKLLLHEHCAAAAEYIKQNYPTHPNFNRLYFAALVHDIGKPFTKTHYTLKNKFTTDAHYYSHQNVGAYLSLLFNEIKSPVERLKLSQLICYHMQPYFTETDRAKRRWKEYLGEELYEQIMILHAADKAAH